MSDIAKRGSTEVTNDNANPFIAYGDAQNRRTIVGHLLRFTKGDFLAGQDDDEVPVGTEFNANMDEMLAGWQRWQDNKPTDGVMGKVSEGYQPPRRNELGDTDKEQWELDAKGEPRDPWQFTNLLLLKDAKGQLYTFATSSRGGLNALGDLCKVYGQAMAKHPDEYPVIAIGVNAYDHSNKTFGRIKVPTFKVVGWAPKAVFAENVDAIVSGVKVEEEPASKKTKGGSRY